MPSDQPSLHPLTCFPGTACDAVARLQASARRTDAGLLVLTYALEGELSRLRLPSSGPPRRGRDLWRSSCFEAFLARAEEDAYYELNVTSGREWDALAFRRYRDGGPLSGDDLAPRIDVRRDASRLELETTVDLARLDPGLRAASLRVGLAAVIEDAAGALSYWALRHAVERPDFHATESFALRLDAPA